VHGALLAKVRRCSQGSSSTAARHRAPRVGAAARSLRWPKPELAAAEEELACGQVPSSPRPREACGSPGEAHRQPGVEFPAPEAIVGVARISWQPWAEHERISPASRRRAPRSLGEARRRGHRAPHAAVRPPPGPAKHRPVVGRRSLSHPILQGKPNASHVCARINLHTHDRQKDCNTIAVIKRMRVKLIQYSLLHSDGRTRRSKHKR
jgi:hypothetical protein